MKEEVSDCCKAPMRVGGKGTSIGSTHWNECTECNESCDIFVDDATREKKLKWIAERKEQEHGM